MILTFGTVALLLPEAEMVARAPGFATTLGDYINAWDPPLQGAYARVALAEGERQLFLSLAPNGHHAAWIVPNQRGKVGVENDIAREVLSTLTPPQGLLAPVAIASAFWLGPAAVPVSSFGGPRSLTVPQEWQAIAAQLAAAGRQATITAIVDEYWKARGVKWDLRPVGVGTTPRANESLRDALRRGAGLKPLEPGELPVEFLDAVRAVFLTHPEIGAAWLVGWMTWPDRPNELVFKIRLDSPDASAITAILGELNQIGGPACVAAAGDHQDPPFYRR